MERAGLEFVDNLYNPLSPKFIKYVNKRTFQHCLYFMRLTGMNCICVYGGTILEPSRLCIWGKVDDIDIFMPAHEASEYMRVRPILDINHVKQDKKDTPTTTTQRGVVAVTDDGSKVDFILKREGITGTMGFVTFDLNAVCAKIEINEDENVTVVFENIDTLNALESGIVHLNLSKEKLNLNCGETRSRILKCTVDLFAKYGIQQFVLGDMGILNIGAGEENKCTIRNLPVLEETEADEYSKYLKKLYSMITRSKMPWTLLYSLRNGKLLPESVSCALNDKSIVAILQRVEDIRQYPEMTQSDMQNYQEMFMRNPCNVEYLFRGNNAKSYGKI